MATPKIGQEVKMCGSAQEEVRAQVTKVNDDGTVDLALYDANGCIAGGASRCDHADQPAQRIAPGHWW
jgi:hypothetical protein